MSKLLTLMLGVLSAGAIQANEADDWLVRMDEAAQTLNYQGDFVYVRGGAMRQFQALHLVDSQGSHVRLTTVDGPPAQIQRHGQPVAATRPGGAQTLPDSQKVLFSAVLPQRLRALKELYSFSMLGTDRVAGRPTQIIHARPRDGYRYGFQLWADIDHGLLLKAVMIGARSEAVEQYSFSRIELNPQVDPQLVKGDATEKIRADSGGDTLAKTTTDRVGSATWKVTDVPRGFALQASSRYLDQPQTVDYLLFSDGLATVSVFVEPLEKGHSRNPLITHRQGVSAMMGAVSDSQVTVIGEVPSATLSLILNSIKPVSPSRPGFSVDSVGGH